MKDGVHIHVGTDGETSFTLKNASLSNLGPSLLRRIKPGPWKTTEVYPDSGFLYLITDENLVKIGRASDAEKRLRTLQTGSARELRMVERGMYDDVKSAENLFHRAYKRFRKRGEWFQFPPNVLDRIRGLIKSGLLPDDDTDISWDGLIDPCPYCRGRGYVNGWCLDCGRKMPHTKPVSALDRKEIQ